jgi:hypothetical protein
MKVSDQRLSDETLNRSTQSVCPRSFRHHWSRASFTTPGETEAPGVWLNQLV